MESSLNHWGGGGGGVKCILLVPNLRPRFCCSCSTNCFKLVYVRNENSFFIVLAVIEGVCYRNAFYFCVFYQFVNSGESLTNLVKPKGLYVKFVSDSQRFTHRYNPQKEQFILYTCMRVAEIQIFEKNLHHRHKG